MRKIIFSMLLATVAVSPALAQDRQDDGDRRDHWRHSQQQQTAQPGANRPDREQGREQFRAQREAERPQYDGNRSMAPQFSGNRPQRPQFDGQRPTAEQIQAWRQQRGDGTARWNRDNVQQSGEVSHWTRQPDQRSGETGRWTRDRSGGWSQPGGDYRQREAWQQQQQRFGQRHSSGGWNRDWRNDRRYDWRRYREQHRSVFTLGIYSDPFGYSYRPYRVGYQLNPAYFGQRYWFDAGMFGLPYPPPGTQWIRYWDDALLVDMYSGQVIDVIPNFFW